MSRIIAFVRKDVARETAGLATYGAILMGQAIGMVRGWRDTPEAALLFIAMGFAGWVVQFVLVARLIQSDSPVRPGALWRTRPFNPAEIAASKAISIFLVILLPPWILGQFARLWLGFPLGIGPLSEPLYHAAIVSVFCLVALVTPSVARAILMTIGLLVLFGFSLSAIGAALSPIDAPNVPGNISPLALLSVCFLVLAAGSMMSSYTKGALARPFIGVAFLGGLMAVFASTGYSPEPSEHRPPANERFAIRVRWRPSTDGSHAGWYGRLVHSTGDTSTIVKVVRPVWRHGYRPPGQFLEREGGEGADIPGLGSVRVGENSTSSFEAPDDLGPLDERDFPSGILTHPLFPQSFSYDTRSYSAIARTDAGIAASLSGRGWRLSVAPPMFGGGGREVWLKTTNSDLAIGLYDPADGAIKFLSPGGGGSFESFLWPLGSGIQVMSFYAFDDSLSGRRAVGKELVLLRETIQGEGTAEVRGLRLLLPPDWKSQVRESSSKTALDLSKVGSCSAPRVSITP